MANEFRALVGFPRWTDEVTYTASSENVLYPATNLNKLPLSYPWRSTSTAPANTVINGKLNTPRLVSFIGLCRHNLSTGARVRVEIGELQNDLDEVVPVYTGSSGTLAGVDGTYDVYVTDSVGNSSWSSVVVSSGTGTITTPSGLMDITTWQAWAVGNLTSNQILSYEGVTTVTPVYTIEKDAWDVLYTEDEVDWEGGNWWDRTYSEEQRQGYTWHLVILMEEEYYASSVRISIMDEFNPDGYIEVGLSEVAQSHTLPVNFSAGAEYGYKSRTDSVQSEGGTEFFRRRSKARVFRGSVDHMPRDTAMSVWLEMQRQLDLDIPFFWLPNPADSVHRIRNAYLARFSEIPLLSYATQDSTDSVPIMIKEVL